MDQCLGQLLLIKTAQMAAKSTVSSKIQLERILTQNYLVLSNSCNNCD